MLYPVISLINGSPALLPSNGFNLDPKDINWELINLDGRIHLDGKGENLFLVRIGVLS